jgi:prenyl protein peptidase
VWFCLPDPSWGSFVRYCGLVPNIWSVSIPVVVTMALFLGPIVQGLVDHPEEWKLSLLHDTIFGGGSAQTLIFCRNYLVAPIAEEWVFRACMIPILFLAKFSFSALVFFPPLYFGLAHTHHVLSILRERNTSVKQAVVIVLFQVFYTTVFGSMAAYYFLISGSVFGCIIAHAFCNFMGFPDFKGALESSNNKLFVSSYLVGIVSFTGLMIWMPDLSDFNSIYY